MSLLDVVDIVRIVAIGLGTALVGLAAVVVRFYFLAHRVTPGSAGLLPSHVWKIGVSYLLFVLSAVVEVVLRLDHPLSWRLPLYGAAALIGLWALSDIARYEHRRIHFGRTSATATATAVVVETVEVHE